jgi:hypothetical protein
MRPDRREGLLRVAGRRATTRPAPELFALGAAVVAVVCCAGLPLLAAAVAGATLAAVAGVGAGVVFLASAAVVLLVRARGKSEREAR